MTVCSSVGRMPSKNGGRGFESHHTVAYIQKPLSSGFFISFFLLFNDNYSHQILTSGVDVVIYSYFTSLNETTNTI